MFDRRPADILRSSHHLVSRTSCNWVPQTSRGCPRLGLLNICYSCKTQEQICNTRTIASEKTIFSLNYHFLCWFPQGPLKVPDVTTFRGPSGDVPRTSCAGWVSLLRLIFLHFVSALSNSSLFMKLFLLLSFFSFFLLLVVFFSALMLCKSGFYFLFRNGVSFKPVSGENKTITPEMVAGWNETTLPILLSNYDLENTQNADEFGLFYQCLPGKS